MPTHHIQLDTAVIGGGIAGLWVANRLKNAGQSVALFETQALGCGQTLASQGMIHGGMKYTLSGAFTQASETIADMPKHWRACLCGDGDLDLRETRILSDHFFLWSTDSISSQLTGFLASKLTRGRITPVDELHYPPLLRHRDFKGHINKLEDLVLDVPSLVANLGKNLHGHCFKLDEASMLWHKDQDKIWLELTTDSDVWRIDADEFIFCAGKNNETLLQQLGLSEPAQQIRPLQQVMVKHRNHFPFYGHCLGASTTPRLTISSHWLNPQEQVWYLGGLLAERGGLLAERGGLLAERGGRVKENSDGTDENNGYMNSDELIELARQELTDLVPWLDLSHAEWSCLPIERAEAQQPGLTRPDSAFTARAKGAKNLIVGWPTKLTLAPNLANQVFELMDTQPKRSFDAGLNQLREHFSSPVLGMTPWALAFPPALSAEERLALLFPESDEYDHENIAVVMDDETDPKGAKH